MESVLRTVLFARDAMTDGWVGLVIGIILILLALLASQIGLANPGFGLSTSST